MSIIDKAERGLCIFNASVTKQIRCTSSGLNFFSQTKPCKNIYYACSSDVAKFLGPKIPNFVLAQMGENGSKG